jgi:transcriptional regulator with XRE-family HTH domain
MTNLNSTEALTLIEKFKNRLYELRREKNISALELGNNIGVKKSTIYSWEHGVNFPNNETLIKLAEFFDVTTDFLLGKTDENQRNNYMVAFDSELEDLSDDQKQMIKNLIDTFRKGNK